MRPNALWATFLLPAALFGVAACAEPADRTAETLGSAPELNAPFDERLEYALAAIALAEMPVIVGVVHGDGDLQLYEFGALAEDGVPPAQSQIDINSITKTVTGVMAARLVEMGRVRFDTRLDEIFPAIPEDKGSITLHQLLTHSAGFRESVGDDAETISREDFLDRAFESRLIAEPGDEYNYSNTGYGIVAAIIEERSGKSYEDFLREDVLGDLELENTGYMSVYDDDRSIRTAGGETILEASWGGHRPYWHLIGNGGLVSTIPDMIAFRQAVAGGRILSSDLLTQVQTPHVAEDEEGSSHYGYGLVVQEVDGVGRIYWHDGGNDVFSAQWGDYAGQGDLLFTAGGDSRKGNAFEAMLMLERYLYGYGDDED